MQITKRWLQSRGAEQAKRAKQAQAETTSKQRERDTRRELFCYRSASLHFCSKSSAILSIFCFSSVLMDITRASCCCLWVSISSWKTEHKVWVAAVNVSSPTEGPLHSDGELKTQRHCALFLFPSCHSFHPPFGLNGSCSECRVSSDVKTG